MFNETELRDKMGSAIAYFTEQIAAFNAINSTASIIETTKVDYYGSQTPISQMAMVVQDKNRVMVTPHQKDYIGKVSSALRTLNMNSYMHSKSTICVTVPLMSGEQKTKVVGHIKKIAEQSLISVRSIRRDARMGQDLTKAQERLIQEITDDTTKSIASARDLKISNIIGE